ncbi:hypothetical protein LI90_3800 [Carbonactinospora thermoautotrophica]|nr:hypothetical protein [Carbonactinospora thermoautotrophica]KWX02754.1 hypothetical protein LI90_3800 [Carbonactinospora thermoautotrophica]
MATTLRLLRPGARVETRCRGDRLRRTVTTTPHGIPQITPVTCPGCPNCRRPRPTPGGAA